MSDVGKLVVLALIAVVFGFAIVHEISIRADCTQRGGVLVKDLSWDGYGCVQGAI